MNILEILIVVLTLLGFLASLAILLALPWMKVNPLEDSSLFNNAPTNIECIEDKTFWKTREDGTEVQVHQVAYSDGTVYQRERTDMSFWSGWREVE